MYGFSGGGETKKQYDLFSFYFYDITSHMTVSIFKGRFQVLSKIEFSATNNKTTRKKEQNIR